MNSSRLKAQLQYRELINEHITIISRKEMIVFITEPFRLEVSVHPISYFKGQIDYAKQLNGKLVLTPYGFYLASKTFENLTRKARLFWAHKSELKDFLADYHDSKSKLEKEIAESRKITNEYREKADWNRTAESFKSLRLLLERQSSLYGKMFSERFGENEGILYEEEIEKFFKKVGENT